MKILKLVSSPKVAKQLLISLSVGFLLIGCKATQLLTKTDINQNETQCSSGCSNANIMSQTKMGTISGKWRAWGSQSIDRPKDSDESILTHNVPWNGTEPLTFVINSTHDFNPKYNGFNLKLFPVNDDFNNFSTMVAGQTAMLQSKGFWILPAVGKVASGYWELLDDTGNAISIKYKETVSVWQSGTFGPHTLVELKDEHLMLVELTAKDGQVGCSIVAGITIDNKKIQDLHGNTQPLYRNNTILVYGKKLATTVQGMGSACPKTLNNLSVKIIETNSIDPAIRARFGL